MAEYQEGAPGAKPASPVVWIVLALGALLVVAVLVVGGFFLLRYRAQQTLAREHYRAEAERARAEQEEARWKAKGPDGEETEVAVAPGGEATSVKTKGGTFTMGGAVQRLPAWLPAYPRSKPGNAFDQRTDNKHIGNVMFQSADGVPLVMGFYRDKLSGLGEKVEPAIMEVDGKPTVGTLEVKDPAHQRSVSISAVATPNGTQVTLHYEEPDQ